MHILKGGGGVGVKLHRAHQGHPVLVSTALWHVIVISPCDVPGALSLPQITFSWSVFSLVAAHRLSQSINFLERRGRGFYIQHFHLMLWFLLFLLRNSTDLNFFDRKWAKQSIVTKHAAGLESFFLCSLPCLCSLTNVADTVTEILV